MSRSSEEQSGGRVRATAKALAVAILAGTPLIAERARADEEGSIWREAFRNFTITPGITVSSPTLRVDRRSDRWEGDISSSPGSLGFDLNVTVLEYVFPGTSWGASLHSNSGTFAANRQFVYVGKDNEGKDDFALRDLGTRVNGVFSYVVPSVFYVVHGKGEYVSTGRIGAGVGYGAVKFNGDVVLAPNRDVSAASDKVGVGTEVNRAFSFVGYYSVLFKSGLEFRVAVTTTRTGDANYKYSFEEFRLTLSKPMTLFK